MSVGLQQKELAKAARLDPTTINRMEKSGDLPVRGHGPNIQCVIDALEKKGVAITDKGVELTARGR